MIWPLQIDVLGGIADQIADEYLSFHQKREPEIVSNQDIFISEFFPAIASIKNSDFGFSEILLSSDSVAIQNSGCGVCFSPSAIQFLAIKR